jgi:hypothetical protein
MEEWSTDSQLLCQPAALTMRVPPYHPVYELVAAVTSAFGPANRMFAQSWTRFKVSWRTHPNQSTLRTITCCSCCLLAASALGLLPYPLP